VLKGKSRVKNISHLFLRKPQTTATEKVKEARDLVPRCSAGLVNYLIAIAQLEVDGIYC
jgi:hypothetical protein